MVGDDAGAHQIPEQAVLLQQGEPVADVALYVPNEDLFATMGRAQSGSLDTWREAHQRIPSAIPAIIRTSGLGLRPDR